MLVHELVRSKGYKKPKKRLGRWNASWKGNYCTRGIKWQKARSGWGKPIWFEWGQTPLLRRLPKLKWFKRYYKLVTTYQIVNVKDLNEFENNSVINKEILVKKGLIKKVNKPVKILWDWELTKALKIEWIEAFSKSAREKIEKAGGQIL